MATSRRTLLKLAGAATTGAGLVNAQTNWRSRLSPSVTALLRSASHNLATNLLNGTATAEHFHATATAFALYMANVNEAGGTAEVEQAVLAHLNAGRPLDTTQILSVLDRAQKAAGISLAPASIERLTTQHYAGFPAFLMQFTTLTDANAAVAAVLNNAAQYAPMVRKTQGQNDQGTFCWYATWVTTYISVVIYVAGIADTILIPVGVTLLWLCQ